jgi:hypothetical protein
MLRRYLAFTLALLILGIDAASPVDIAAAEILVHETFTDGNISDNQPAIWTPTCFGRECSPGFPEAQFATTSAGHDVTFKDFVMWRLDEVQGEVITERNVWSIRARIDPIRQTSNAMIVGVGLDEYYWAAAFSENIDNPSDVGVGRYFDPSGSIPIVPMDPEWFVQIDVYPDYLEGFRWTAGDLSAITSTTWERGEDIEPGLPVFWGNFGGQSIFREVLVSTEYLSIGGDFNRDRQLDIADLQMLSDQIRSPSPNPEFNLDTMLGVDFHDLATWVHTGGFTYFGDANLDRQFDSSDLIQVFAAGQYEDQVASNSGWAEGDWNADGEFDTMDLIVAFQDGGYAMGPRNAPPSVPEPASVVTLLTGLLFCAARLRTAR